MRIGRWPERGRPVRAPRANSPVPSAGPRCLRCPPNCKTISKNSTKVSGQADSGEGPSGLDGALRRLRAVFFYSRHWCASCIRSRGRLMKSVAETIPEHERSLALQAGSVEDHLPAFKRLLRIESGRMRTRHRLGATGGAIVEARTRLLDDIIRRALGLAADPARELRPDSAGLSLIALGGYGRRELAPGSDIDLLFLHEGKGSAQLDSIVESLLYLLWDLGLTLGHCCRTVEECAKLASEDLISRNALADARFLAGDSQLHLDLTSRLESTVFARSRQVERYVRAMEAGLLERHERFGPGWGFRSPISRRAPAVFATCTRSYGWPGRNSDAGRSRSCTGRATSGTGTLRQPPRPTTSSSSSVMRCTSAPAGGRTCFLSSCRRRPPSVFIVLQEEAGWAVSF